MIDEKLMIYIVAIIIVVGFVIYFFCVGSIKYQVKFYIKRYSEEVNAGHTHEETILRLVGFYLQKEPEWKAAYMKERLDEYFKSFDQLVYDITLFYYKIDAEQQTWGVVDSLSKPVPSEHVIQYADKYLSIYKRKYFGILDNVGG